MIDHFENVEFIIEYVRELLKLSFTRLRTVGHEIDDVIELDPSALERRAH